VYETHAQALLSPGRFLRRLSLHAGAAIVLFLPSLAIGMAGYMYFESLPWRDAFLNAFLATAAIVIAPLVHRVLHTFARWEHRRPRS